MKILVTGGTGFVGRALVPILAEKGWTVRATARGSTRIPAGCEFVASPLENEQGLDRLVAGIDAVIHLAARVHVMDSSAADLEAFRAINAVGTRRLAEAAARNGASHFVFVSSIKVNGESTPVQPFRETDAPAPSDPYGVSKLEGELHLREVAAKTGLGVTIFRPPLMYGPGVGGNFARLMRWIEAGVPFPLGGVDNRRSLLFVGNLCSAIVSALQGPPGNSAARTYLVSDAEDLSTPELIRRLAAAMGKQARLFPCPMTLLRAAAALTLRSAELERLTGSLVVDSTLIREQLGWKPVFGVTEGLRQTVGRIATS